MDNGAPKEEKVQSPNLNVAECIKSGQISIAKYRTEVWPELQTCIQKALVMGQGHFYHDSYERFYRNVFWVVQSGLSEALNTDISSLISEHLVCLNRNLMVQPYAVDPASYVVIFNQCLNQFHASIDMLNQLLIYMRVKNLIAENLFSTLFRQIVADKHVHTLIPLMADLQQKAFSVDPEVMQNVVNNLYALHKDYALIRPSLFERFIPNLNPLLLSDLDHHRKEVQRMCHDLRTHPDFHGGDQSKKRRFSES